ncbi:MAG: PEP-CTERM sorting domain-containing protein [Pirellulales bacterium]
MTVTSSSPRRRANTIQCCRFLLLAAAAFLALFASASRSHAVTLADSFNDWSFSGTQGENDWIYGYRNFTLDGGGAYDFTTSFIPFLNDGTGVIGAGNQWTGDHWRLEANPGGTGGPWTELLQENSHPNGTNSQPLQEQWTIRRWVASSVVAPTELALEWQLRKTNTGGGDGVGGFLYLNGVQLDTAAIGGTDGVGVMRTAVATINPGDVIDLALTPGAAHNDGADGSAFRLRITDELPPPPPAPPLADSFADWSTTGTQGQNNWFNGYFRLTGDANGQYDVADFIPFLSDGSSTISATNHWNGSAFRTVASGSPWTFLGAQDTHPQGTNSNIAGGTPPNQEQWTVRRWVADVTETTPLALNWQMRKTNLNNTGVEGKLFVNGVEVDGAAIAGNDGTGVNRAYYANVNPGDIIELALGPTGPTGDRSDGSDGSANRLIIDPNIPAGARNPSGVKLADSQTGWSATGTQGENNWLYGYHDVRADAVSNGGDGQFGVSDFIPFLNDGSGVVATNDPIGSWTSSPNHWNGSAWDLVNNGAFGRGPWTELTPAGGHPAANAQGTPEVHWAVRRWISDFDGDVEIMGLLSNAGAGDGTVGRIFVDGVEVWSAVSDGVAANFDVVATVANGSIVDFAIDPDGANVYNELTGVGLDSISDGSDSTTFTFMIQQAGELFVPIPEPSSIVLGLMGIAGVALVGRRRRR